MKMFFKAIVLFLIVFCLVSYLIENWNKIVEFKYEVDWLYLSLSILSLLGSLFFLPLSLGNVVKLLKHKISIKKMCMVLFYSQIAKYLPGGIWAYVGRVYLYKKEGMSASEASTCVILETLLVILSGIFVFFISLCFLDKIPSIEWITDKYIKEIGIIGLVFLLSLMHPKTLNFLWGLIRAKITKDNLQFDYSYSSLFKPAFILIFFWFGIGVGFWLLIRSFLYVDVNLLPMTTGAFILSWIVGLLAFFTPGGLGAREAVLVLLLNLYLPIYISVIIAAAARIWWITGELIWALFFIVWNRYDAVKNKNKFQKK
ncbi:MAG: flippase-like domain-containing protein [Deltaproteobacteria bacterium]|nr:flippase-like domain-containing protein [Deltaproteobacteria bacterium]